ncbi:thiol-disulfide isomerase [Lactococcus termiticola]|uniref:Uncharacterized protein n=1 Tax=Lactococcus termiticola TaxID=2169526 RepID=A0A2R5HJK3_9LACT|nr:thiol-disulfide isomerase [Lactococcus termiticola]GBG96798.1 hypothetical protein NtB2_00922 [Lactococcus termiticola]
MITINVESLENAEIFWKELGLEEKVALSESYDFKPQTLAIDVEYIDDIYEKVEELGLELSEISPATDGKHLFSFKTPEDNRVIIVGDWVTEPYSHDKRTAFFENIKQVSLLQAEDIEELDEEAVILFGRVTCPWTRYFSQQLAEISSKIYYVDTENTDLSPALQEARRKYDAPTVPTVIRRQADGAFVKMDRSKLTLKEFLED